MYLRQIRDHHSKALGDENLNMLCLPLCDPFLTSFFKITFQIMSKHHWTKQNRIHLVESSCDEISDPSEVPWFDGKLIFS